jgi:hypothetical protein
MPSAGEHTPAAANGGQQPPKPVTIAFVLYPGFTARDIIGPFEVLAFVPVMRRCSWPASRDRSPTTPAGASWSQLPAWTR